MEEAFNCLIQCGGVQVRPGDIVMADSNGVVIVHHERLEEVLSEAEAVFEKEKAMVEEIQKGASMVEVDARFAWEAMLKK